LRVIVLHFIRPCSNSRAESADELLELPGLTGGAVIRQLKNDPSTSGIPVIVTTFSDRESPLVQEAFDPGAARILYRPTPMNVLTVEVNRYLSSDVA